MPCIDAVDEYTRQHVLDKFHNDTASAIIECLKRHDDLDLVEGDLIIRLVSHNMIDFKLDGSVGLIDYAVDVLVDGVAYLDDNSFTLFYSGSKYARREQCGTGDDVEIDRIPNSAQSIVIRSDSGMRGTFVNPRDFLRLLGLVKYTVEVVLAAAEE